MAVQERVVGSDGAQHVVPPDFSSRLYNEDLAPSTERDWGVWSLFCMWMADIHSIGGYTFAAGLFFLGLNGWWVLAALAVATFAVLGLMNLTGYAGQRLGVPYPVLARLSFGVLGANIPAIVRAIVGIAWYGIQTYLASFAVQILLLKMSPGLERWTDGGFLGLSPLGWACFLLVWAAQLLLIRRGMKTIRHFVDFAGPAIWIAMFALAIWVAIEAGGRMSFAFSDQQLSGGEQVREFFAVISLTVSYFAALLLNFCDFSRFAPSKRAVRIGNLLGLPLNFLAFAALSAVVTAGTVAIYGEFLTDPVEVVARLDSVVVLIIGALTFTIATLGINVVANFVSAAYDLSNVAPKKLDFRRAGVIAAVLSLLVMPWELYGSPVAINYFLGALGAFLGPLFGIMMVDYWVIRRERVNVAELYKLHGDYSYRSGFNPRAVGAFVVTATPTTVLAVVPAFSEVAPFAWPIGVVLAGLVYGALMRNQPVPGTVPVAPDLPAPTRADATTVAP